MPEYSRNPILNMNAMLLETGLTADVVRVWEKRYGLPRPMRTPGGHRLYSQYDVELVKWLQSRQLEGLSISRAAGLWRELSSDGRDPLAGSESEAASLIETALPEADTRIKVLRNHWLDACLVFDRQGAEDLLNQAIALYPIESVCLEILQWGLKAIGDLWYAGKASVTQEHFTSGLAINRIEALILAVPQPTREHTVLISCPAGEMHAFPPLLLTLLLRVRGWNVINLGTDVPASHLVETSQLLSPDIVILVAQTLPAAAALSHTVEALRPLNIPVAYGGLVFNRVPALRDLIPAWFLGESVSEAVPHVAQLASEQLIFPAEKVGGVSLAAVTQLFQEMRPQIEAALVKHLLKEGLEIKYILAANTYFNRYLTAALELGSPAYGEVDLEWINLLLSGRQILNISLGLYLHTYGQAVNTVMGPSGTIISSWLESIAPKY